MFITSYLQFIPIITYQKNFAAIINFILPFLQSKYIMCLDFVYEMDFSDLNDYILNLIFLIICLYYWYSLIENGLDLN
jgi:hypothetical protein